MRLSARVLACLAALILLAACAETAQEQGGPGASASRELPPPTRTSGPLADGFEIEPGSSLMGAVFPLAFGEGGKAVLRVDGDAHRVVDGYIRQAQKLGFSRDEPEFPGPNGAPCTDPHDDVKDERTGPFPVRCEASGHKPDDLIWNLYGFLGLDDRGYLFILVGTARRSVESEPLPPIPDGPVASVTDVEVAPGMTPEFDEAVRVVEGSAVIADPLPWDRGTGGYVAVLQVTGELIPILRRYQDQFTSDGFASVEGLTGNDDVMRVSTWTAGGGTLDAVAVAGNPSYLMIERYND